MDDKEFAESYTKGYNNGYLLSRFEPKTFEVIMKNPIKSDPYFDGMGEGKRAVDRELFLENLKKVQEMKIQNKPRMR